MVIHIRLRSLYGLLGCEVASDLGGHDPNGMNMDLNCPQKWVVMVKMLLVITSRDGSPASDQADIFYVQKNSRFSTN